MVTSAYSTIPFDQSGKYDRQLYIGGSDAAAAVGLSPWKSPFQLWMEKTGRTEPLDLSDNERVYWGSRLEPVIASEFRSHHPEFTVTAPVRAAFVSTTWPFAACTPDGTIISSEHTFGIWEGKTADKAYAKQYQEQEVPLQYRCQVVHNMAVTGASFGWLSVLCGGNQYMEVLISRDESEVERLMELESAFWHLVKTDTPPQVIGHKDEPNAMLGFYGLPTGDIVTDYSDEAIEACLTYIEASEVIRENEAAKIKAANYLRSLIGDAYGLDTGLYHVTWSRFLAKRLDTTALKAAHPGLAASFEVSEPRNGRLTVKEVR